MKKGSLREITKEYEIEVIIVPSPKVIIPLETIKNLKEWSIFSSLLQIIGATLLGGTFLGHNLPLLFGSIGAIMIAVGVLIEVIKFGGFIRLIKKKGTPIKILYYKKGSTIT
jgi:pheromone shutdown protein TraB